jgi:hypothetical protein
MTTVGIGIDVHIDIDIDLLIHIKEYSLMYFDVDLVR